MTNPSTIPWRVFFGISSFQMLAMFRRGLFYSFLSIYLRHFLGLSVTETTLFATLPMVLNIVFQTFVWGSFSDKHQLRRTIIIWGEAMAGFGTIGVWGIHRLAPGPVSAGYAIIIGLSVVEIFWSMSNVGWSALISDIYREGERNAVQGRLASIGGLGRIAGVWIGGLLYDGLSEKYAGWGFHEGALFFVASAAMFISVLPMLMVPEGGVSDETVAAEKQREASESGRTKRWFIVFILAMTFINFGRNSIALTMTQYLVLENGLALSSRMLGHVVNVQSAAMVITGLFAGWFGRKMGDGNAMLFAAAVGIFSLVFLGVADSTVSVVVVNFLRGVADVILMAASYAFASRLIPAHRRAKWFGVYNATLFLSWGVGATLIAGPLIDILYAMGYAEVTAYKASFFAAAGITLVGFFLQIGLMLQIKAKK